MGYIRRVVPAAAAAAAVALLVMVPIASAQVGSLTTGNTNEVGWATGAYVDITATVPLSITSFEVYFKSSTTRNVSVYYKAGTYAGSEATPGAWTLLGTVSVTPGADGTLTVVNLAGVAIPAGQTYGFYFWDSVDKDVGGMLLDQDPVIHSNTDMSLFAGYYNFGMFELYSNTWGWQGTVHYTLGEQAVPALGTAGLVGLVLLVFLLGWGVLRQRCSA